MVAKFDVLSQFFKPVYKICMTLTSFIHFQGDRFLNSNKTTEKRAKHTAKS